MSAPAPRHSPGRCSRSSTQLGELRGITIAVQALGAKLDAVLRQVGSSGRARSG